MKSMSYGRMSGIVLALLASWVALGVARTSAGQSDEAAIREVFDQQTAAWNRGTPWLLWMAIGSRRRRSLWAPGE